MSRCSLGNRTADRGRQPTVSWRSHHVSFLVRPGVPWFSRGCPGFLHAVGHSRIDFRGDRSHDRSVAAYGSLISASTLVRRAPPGSESSSSISCQWFS